MTDNDYMNTSQIAKMTNSPGGRELAEILSTLSGRIAMSDQNPEEN